MNFLAHAYLAQGDSSLVVGGVIGDWIKGPLPAGLPPDLARGVALHRAIDSHAEQHAGFCASRRRVSPARRRYGGVIVDIVYDHLLAQQWPQYHPQPLADFCAQVYAELARRLPELPPSAHWPLALMVREDWLGSYARIEGIADVFRRMARRARQPNPLAGAEQELLDHAEALRADFALWREEASRFAADWSARPGVALSPTSFPAGP